MKKVIRGRLYDTETARELGSHSGGSEYNDDFEHFSEVLYRKRTGEYFLHGSGGPKSPYAERRGKSIKWGEKIVPLTPDAAAKWAEKYLDPEIIMQEFGAPADDWSRKMIHISLSVNAAETVKKYAAAHDTSVSAAIEQLIKEELKMKEFRTKSATRGEGEIIMTTATVLSISYALDKTITMRLSGHPHLVHVRIENIKGGKGAKSGKECYIDRLVVGGKIAYENISRMGMLTECVILSDGLTEVDLDGNLIRW